MTKLVMPRIDRKLLSKKDYIIGSLRKIIKAENIFDHEDRTRDLLKLMRYLLINKNH